jgi:hypothetical protein
MDIPITAIVNNTITSLSVSSILSYTGIILLALLAVPVLYLDFMALVSWAAAYRPN